VTSPRRRLDALTSTLGARERALFILRRWCAEEPWDTRLRDLMPEEQREEYDRITQAVEGASETFHGICAAWVEWLTNADQEMAWLECLAAFLAREKALLKVLKTRGLRVTEGNARSRPAAARDTVPIPSMPPPARGFKRELPQLWGKPTQDDPPVPPNWQAAARTLADELKACVLVRWREAAAMEQVLDEMAEALGEPLVHHAVREALVACERKVLDLYEASQRFTGRYSLPEPTEEEIGKFRGWANVEALRAIGGQAEPKRGRRDWLGREEREELERLEADVRKRSR
jgi:hypothetical protein